MSTNFHVIFLIIVYIIYFFTAPFNDFKKLPTLGEMGENSHTFQCSTRPWNHHTVTHASIGVYGQSDCWFYRLFTGASER